MSFSEAVSKLPKAVNNKYKAVNKLPKAVNNKYKAVNNKWS